jgi:hypothetical protein
MTPTIVLTEAPRLVAGSAVVRLAGAIVQVGGGGRPGSTGCRGDLASRLHVDGDSPRRRGWAGRRVALEEEGTTSGAGADRNLFFGGASAAERRPNGILAAGDPRRGGTGSVA